MFTFLNKLIDFATQIRGAYMQNASLRRSHCTIGSTCKCDSCSQYVNSPNSMRTSRLSEMYYFRVLYDWRSLLFIFWLMCQPLPGTTEEFHRPTRTIYQRTRKQSMVSQLKLKKNNVSFRWFIIKWIRYRILAAAFIQFNIRKGPGSSQKKCCL